MIALAIYLIVVGLAGLVTLAVPPVGYGGTGASCRRTDPDWTLTSPLGRSVGAIRLCCASDRSSSPGACVSLERSVRGTWGQACALSYECEPASTVASCEHAPSEFQATGRAPLAFPGHRSRLPADCPSDTARPLSNRFSSLSFHVTAILLHKPSRRDHNRL